MRLASTSQGVVAQLAGGRRFRCVTVRVRISSTPRTRHAGSIKPASVIVGRVIDVAPRMSQKALTRLGEALVAGPLDPEQADLFEAVIGEYDVTRTTAQGVLAERMPSAFPALEMEITGRTKTTLTLRDKLRRTPAVKTSLRSGCCRNPDRRQHDSFHPGRSRRSDPRPVPSAPDQLPR